MCGRPWAVVVEVWVTVIDRFANEIDLQWNIIHHPWHKLLWSSQRKQKKTPRPQLTCTFLLIKSVGYMIYRH